MNFSTNLITYETKNTSDIKKNDSQEKSYPSLCIPRMSSNISRNQISKTFDSLKLGTLERIDIIPVGKGDFQRVFIHFKSWNTHSLEVSKIREKIISGEYMKIIYDGPFIWKILLNRASIHK